MSDILLQGTLYLAAMVAATGVSRRLGLGSVLGYLGAGLLIGPVTGLAGHELHDLREFAEFGVIMMLFLIGLELEPRLLWAMRRQLLGIGGAQILASTATIALAATWLAGLAPRTALAVGMILSLSSTAIVLQTLSEKRLLGTQGGRASFAVLLMQDIAVVPMLAALPLLAGRATAELQVPVAVPIAELPAWAAALVTLAAAAALLAAGPVLLRHGYALVAAARMRELNAAFALLIVVGLAALMNALGLSPGLGAFLGGMMLANSEFRHEIQADVEPFKGLLLGLFFVTVGAGIDLGTLAAAPGEIAAITGGIILAKLAVLLPLARLAGLEARDRWLFSLGLAQAGEFGFVLIAAAGVLGVLPPPLGEKLVVAVALTMLATPLLFMLHDRIARRLGRGEEALIAPGEQEITPGAVIIGGGGRVGQVINRLLRHSGVQATVIDHKLKRVRLLRRFGHRAFFGDPTRPQLLEAAGVDEARILVAALGNPEANTRLVRLARGMNPALHIVARAYDRLHVYELYAAGADRVARETFDSAVRMGRYTLEFSGFPEAEADRQAWAFWRLDRAAVRQLAEVWTSDRPIADNPAYQARAELLEEELGLELARIHDRQAHGAHPAPPAGDQTVPAADTAATSSPADSREAPKG